MCFLAIDISSLVNFCIWYEIKVNAHCFHTNNTNLSVQFSSVTQPCPTLCNPINCSTPDLPVHHQLPEFTQIHVHRVRDAIQPSHPLSSPLSVSFIKKIYQKDKLFHESVTLEWFIKSHWLYMFSSISGFCSVSLIYISMIKSTPHCIN